MRIQKLPLACGRQQDQSHSGHFDALLQLGAFLSGATMLWIGNNHDPLALRSRALPDRRAGGGMKEVSKEKAMQILHDYVRGCGSQKNAAKLMGISEQYLSDVLNGRRYPGCVLNIIGIGTVLKYRVPKRVGIPGQACTRRKR